MLSSVVRKSLFHAVCVHFTEGFLRVNLINNPYQCKVKENLTVTKKKEVDKALDAQLKIVKKTIRILKMSLVTWKVTQSQEDTIKALLSLLLNENQNVS